MGYSQPSADEDEAELMIVSPPLRRRPNTTPQKSAAQRAEEIVLSAYAYSYTEDTGRVAASRLDNMQRSLAQLRSGSGRGYEHLVRSGSPPETATGIDNDRTVSEMLAIPYMDISRPQPYEMSVHSNDHSAERPTLFRRVSSVMSLPLQATVPHLKAVDTMGLDATPLHHVPSKLVLGGGRAVVITSLQYPYPILTLNDFASLILNESHQAAHAQPMMDFLAQGSRKMVEQKLGKGTTHLGTKVCGDLVELAPSGVDSGPLVAVWAEASVRFLVWAIDKVADATSVSIPMEVSTASTEPSPQLINGKRIVRAGSKTWIPRVLAGVIVVEASTHNIVAVNAAMVRYLLARGPELVGESVTTVLPQFEKLWRDAIVDADIKPGLIVPEHKFRQLAGVTGADFLAVNPHPTKIVARTAEGVDLGVDFQVRVVSSELLAVWISHSHVDVTVDPLPRPPSRSPTPASAVAAQNDTSHSREPPLPAAAAEVGKNRRTTGLDDYEELRLLGRGAYGEVHLVKRRRDSAIVALKSVIKTRILVDSWSRDRKLGGTVPNEIRILNELRGSPHLAIVELLDFWENSECFYLEMPAVGGGNGLDLFDYVENGAATEPPASASVRVREIFSSLASAVFHLHTVLSVVHRDLKDENVIIDCDNRPRLVDFGSAAYVRQGPFDVFVGTIDYAAPEVVAGTPYTGPPQDCWALGILLYTLVYRENPFRSVEEIMGTPSSTSTPASSNGTPPVMSPLASPARSSDSTPREGPVRPRGTVYHYSGPSTDDVGALRCFEACTDLIDALLVRDVSKRLDIKGIMSSEYVSGCSDFCSN